MPRGGIAQPWVTSTPVPFEFGRIADRAEWGVVAGPLARLEIAIGAPPMVLIAWAKAMAHRWRGERDSRPAGLLGGAPTGILGGQDQRSGLHGVRSPARAVRRGRGFGAPTGECPRHPGAAIAPRHALVLGAEDEREVGGGPRGRHQDGEVAGPEGGFGGEGGVRGASRSTRSGGRNCPLPSI
ncbi:MAG: hypothetical protein QOJ59_3770 [Thermomicrobiales bacterium]|jgi:hypothetical protein|nr:hypothetical protein [Thermomicrobiales bacterium]